MSDLQYYTTDEFLNLYVKGDKSIDEMLSLDNLKHTTTYRISFLNHLLYLCKTNNTSLLDVMNRLKDMIVNYMKRLINENFYIKSYIETIIKEWSLILEADDIFDDMKGVFKYDDFIQQNKIYNELVGGMKGLERGIQNREYVIDGELKDMMLLLHTNCKDCKEKILYHIQNLLDLINEIEPTYNYLLIDLSMKSKTNYLEKVDEIHDNSSVFGRLLNTSTDKDIPKNINKIFMNYILVINMLKKEYHYLITTLKSINHDLDNRHGSLDGLVKGLNLQSSSSDSNSTSILDLDESSDDESSY
jgi:hypothetical protein